MSKFKSLLAAILLGFLQPVGVYAQDITNHSMPIGKGPGVVGWGVLGPCGVGQVPVWAGGASSDPTCGFPGSAGVLGVANGGTGQSSLTLDALVVGNGTSAVQLIGPGTTGQALMGVTGSPPFFTGSPIFATSVAAPFFNASTALSGYSLGGVIFANTNGNYTQILSPSSQVSAALLLIGNATDPQVYSRGNVIFQSLGGVQFGSIGTGGSLSLGGSTPAVNGTVNLSGLTSGTITIQPQAAAGTYNFNLPTTPGAAGQVLTSQGGGSTPMNWTAAGNPQPHMFSATFSTDPASTTSTEYYYRCVGGGGGGGGASGSLVAAGGGGSGGFMEGLFTGIAASVTVTITPGTGGTAGSSAGGAGGNGGATTIAATGITTLSAAGGSGAAGNTTGGTGTSGGAGGSTFGGSPTVTVPGHIGQSGGANGSGIIGGQGASSPFASGGFGEMTSGSAVAGGAGGIGAGGAGGGTSTTAAGGAGGAGLCIVMYWL